MSQNEFTIVQFITILISAYAAFLSTAVFVWNIYNAKSDRGKIRVHAFFGYLVGNGTASDVHLIFEYTNVGKKPIQLTNFGGTFYKRYVEDGKWSFVVTTMKLPIKLEPGDRHFEYFPNVRIMDEKVKDFFAYDSLGNKYRLSRKTLKRLKSEVKTI